MSIRNPLICMFLFFSLVQSVCAKPLELPDEKAILAEIDLLIDVTPTVSAKQLKKAAKLVRKGVKLHDKGKFKKSVKVLRKALALAPGIAETYYELSLSLNMLQQLEQSYINVVKALAIDPGFEQAYIQKANILDDAGYPKRAVAAYQELIEIQPESFMAWLNMGITQLKGEDFSASEESFKKASSIEENHPSPYYYLFVANAMQGFNYDEMEYIEKFLVVGAKDHRRKIVEDRLKELGQGTIRVNPKSKTPNWDLVEGLLRLGWRRTLHRAAYPNERGYRPSLAEERAVFDEMTDYGKSSQEEMKKNESLLLKEKIDAAGFFDAHAFTALQKYLGKKDLAWGAANQELIEQYTRWRETSGLF